MHLAHLREKNFEMAHVHVGWLEADENGHRLPVPRRLRCRYAAPYTQPGMPMMVIMIKDLVRALFDRIASTLRHRR